MTRQSQFALRLSPPSSNYAAIDATVAEALRTANDSMTRVMPLIIKLTPTKVPIAQAALDGHCM